MGERGQRSGPSAFDVKPLHESLRGFMDDELKQIPVLVEGTRLEQGATYVDLRDPRRRELVARGDMVVEPGQWIVPKQGVDYRLWNRLLGVDNPERTGEAPER